MVIIAGALKPPMANRGETCSVSRLQSLVRLQAKMLRFALTKFPDVQRVIYSTCSINTEENEGVVEEVLASVNTDPSTPVFQIVDSKLKSKWIHHGSQEFECGPKCICTKSDIDFTTGFFIAVLERVQYDEQIGVSGENEEKEHKKRKKHKK
jgi:putative methyltransferase